MTWFNPDLSKHTPDPFEEGTVNYSEKNLKPCPCGKTPASLLIADNGSKWAYVCGDCCNEWHIEFRTFYYPLESNECMKLAVESWNLSKRNTPTKREPDKN